MGIKVAVVHSDADVDALFVREADEAHSLKASTPGSSYLNVDKIMEIASRCGADAVYPGYGFLSENPQFVKSCEDKGLKFIGPPSHSMWRAKPKHRMRALMEENGIPVSPGIGHVSEVDENIDDVLDEVEKVGYPVIVKPSGGGGGIGIGVAENRDELMKAMKYAHSRGTSAFDVAAFYIERYIPRAKHIEIQVLADEHGNMVYMGERECSVQRRYQKLIEEAPSPVMTPELRQAMGEMALDVARVLEYQNALTVELIYSVDTGEFFFNEVNTRLQVEHPVTELITGKNLVREQIRIAAGEELGYSQEDIKLTGCAIECRINAEDPFHGFLPSPGEITAYDPPEGPDIRVDSGVYAGYIVPFYYDPMIVKLLARGDSRNKAIANMKQALGAFHIEGIKTNIPFHKLALDDDDFKKGEYTTKFVEDRDLVKRVRRALKAGEI